MPEEVVDRASLVKYYNDVAADAKFNEAVNAWGYDKEFLDKCGFSDPGDLFVIACGGGCPLRLEGQLPAKGAKVVDLGCGAGHDVVLAARLVGASGKVIGVDVTPGMLRKTQENVNKFRKPGDADVQLIQGAFDDSSLDQIPSGWADLVTSNGAFNLCEDKLKAFATAYRLLKPGGRFHLTDVVEDPAAMEANGGGGCSGEATACSKKSKEETAELPFDTPGGVTVEGWND
jgi:SAM-dependent methyltransferase